MADHGPELRLPERIETGEFDGALRIGERNDTPVYWHVPTNRIAEIDAPTVDPEAATIVQLSAETVGEYIHRTEREGSRWSLNRLGEFLRNVASFEDVRILTVRQEEAYALCRIANVEAARAAELLGVSEGLLEDHLSTAHKKITCAFNLVEAVNGH
ncbi:MAG: hypothetical protein R6V31_12705 [Halohasta sp.]